MYQKIIVAGNLGRDPEIRYMQDGKPVCNFSVATSERYTDKQGNKVENTTWYRIVVWGNQAEACNTYLKRGSKVLVDGKLIADKATGGPKTFTRSDGSVSASFEIKADTVQFLSGKNDMPADSGNVGNAGNSQQQPSVENDEIPF